MLREDSDAAAEPPQPELAQLPGPPRGVIRGWDDAPGASRPDGGRAAARRDAARRLPGRPEGLTNARKHAPGAIDDVTVTGTEQAGLIAEIVSRRTPGVLPSVAAPQARRAPAGPEAAAASVPAAARAGARAAARGAARAVARGAAAERRPDRPGRAAGAGRRRASAWHQRERRLRAPRDHPRVLITPPIRVLIVDDDALVRSGLTMMLSGAPQIEIVGEASDGRGVLAAVDLHHPDVILMDIRMPRLDGIAATRLVRAQPHPPAVIVLTTFDADELVLRALQAGAAGFLLKDSPPADIVRAIDSVHAGDGTLSPRITRRLISLVAGDPDAAARRERARQRLAAQTPREREVAAAVAGGSSNAEIAARLHMSLATVKAHVSRLLVKLDAANRVQIALLVQDTAASRPR